VKVFERWAIKRTAFTFAAPNDQASIMDANKLDANKFRLTYHLGDESLLEKPTIDLKGNKPRVLFMGTLSWMPNKDGINWYIDHVWPQVVSKMPSAELIICGKGADSNLVNKAANTKGVSYLGFVEDLNAVMETCKAAIIPLRFGSGMKIKTLDAMYRGLPVLSSNVGIDGLDVEHDNHALICQNDEEWVQQTISVLNEESKMQAMADRARALVRDKYVYPQIFRSMLGDMQQTFPSDVS
jgi:glycosyltransferase involved in cell wall biosynthesis